MLPTLGAETAEIEPLPDGGRDARGRYRATAAPHTISYRVGGRQHLLRVAFAVVFWHRQSANRASFTSTTPDMFI